MIRAFNVPIPEDAKTERKGPYVDDIREFVKSGARNAIVEWKKGMSIENAQNSYCVAIGRLGYSDIVGTKTRKSTNTLWLVRKDKKR